jgi:hypothetical protein
MFIVVHDSKHKMIGWSTWEGYRDLFDVCKARKAIPLADYEYTYMELALNSLR